jgi:hypothetical protein
VFRKYYGTPTIKASKQVHQVQDARAAQKILLYFYIIAMNNFKTKLRIYSMVLAQKQT